jgi:hypothetical protein
VSALRATLDDRIGELNGGLGVDCGEDVGQILLDSPVTGGFTLLSS